MAKLPEEYEDKDKLGLLPRGVLVYTLPWAMSVDSGGSCYLNSGYPFTFAKDGTSEMPVKRTDRGYEVWLVPGYKYEKEGGRPNGEWGAIRVAEVHTR